MIPLQHPRPRPSSRLANIISFHNMSLKGLDITFERSEIQAQEAIIVQAPSCNSICMLSYMRRVWCARLSSCSGDFWCIPRIGPARLRRNCRCPRRFRLRRIRHRGQRPCRCLRCRHTLRSSSRPLRRHHMHLPHLLRSCTCPRGYPSRRKPVCVCVCVSDKERQRERER